MEYSNDICTDRIERMLRESGSNSHAGLVLREYHDKRIAELAERIADLENTLSMRDAATEALCIALHGEAVSGKSIYDLVFDADVMARAARKAA